jgi:hypothetical protein
MRTPTVSDPPADVRAAVKASQNATAAAAKERAESLQLALADVPPPSEPAELPDDPPAERTQSHEGPHTPLVAAPAYAPPIDYHALPHLSASDIRRGYHTPEAALWQRLHPTEPTPAMQNGTALHLAVLEPERFASEVAAKPDGLSFVTKEGKEWRAAHEGLLIVSADLHARAAVYAAHSKGVLLQLGATTPRFEVPVLWTDPIAGDCRCKPDCYWLDADGIPHLASVKTTAKPITATEWAATLASTPRGPGYDIGEYHYARGLAAVHLQDAERWPEVVIHHVVLSTEGPPMIAIWELGAAVLHRASTIWADKAPRIAAALTAPMPAVIVIGGTIADVPRWAAMPATEEEA